MNVATKSIGNGKRGPKKKYQKICEYPECKTEFLGIKTAKYCEVHRDSKFRQHSFKQKQKIIADRYPKPNDFVNRNLNYYFFHNIKEKPVDINLFCLCCRAGFNVTIRPFTYIFPQYCTNHRTEHKRNQYYKNTSIAIRIQNLVKNHRDNMMSLASINNQKLYLAFSYVQRNKNFWNTGNFSWWFKMFMDAKETNGTINN